LSGALFLAGGFPVLKLLDFQVESLSLLRSITSCTIVKSGLGIDDEWQETISKFVHGGVIKSL
jgi:hypothetical protein